MFITNFTRLCNSINKSPTAVCLDVGLSENIYTYWKKNNSTPRPAMLQKIADYFGVSVAELTAGENTGNVSINNVSGETVQIQTATGKGKIISPVDQLHRQMHRPIRRNGKPILVAAKITPRMALSPQEKEFVDIYRDFTIEEQHELLTYAFKLRTKKKNTKSVKIRV